jgi:site-specific recombinase XerD
MAKRRKKKRRAKTQLSSTDYLTEEQVRFVHSLLRAAAAHGGFRAATNLFIFELMTITGLRCGEVAALELRDLPTYHQKDAIEVRWETTKSGRSRSVVISEKMSAVIAKFVGRFRRDCKPRSPVLLNENGRRIRTWNIYRRVKTIGRNTGCDWLHPHALRHTYCSLLYRVDRDVFFVQQQAGHVSSETTKLYTHTEDSKRKKQVLSLDFLVCA